MTLDPILPMRIRPPLNSLRKMLDFAEVSSLAKSRFGIGIVFRIVKEIIQQAVEVFGIHF